MQNFLKIIIGGEANIPTWKSMNANPELNPDYLSDLIELKGLVDSTVSVFYLSHVLEHIKLPNLLPTLSKMHSKLIDGGTVYISVPDLDCLSKLLSEASLDINQKIHVLRMIYGGQVNEFDYHYFGYNFEILEAFLKNSGFRNIRRVKNFDLFRDTSSFAPYFSRPISLNIICHK